MYKCIQSLFQTTHNINHCTHSKKCCLSIFVNSNPFSCCSQCNGEVLFWFRAFNSQYSNSNEIITIMRERRRRTRGSYKERGRGGREREELQVHYYSLKVLTFVDHQMLEHLAMLIEGYPHVQSQDQDQ